MKEEKQIRWKTQEEDCKEGNHVAICKCSCGEVVDIEGVMRSYGQKEAKQVCQDMIKRMEKVAQEWQGEECYARKMLQVAKEYLKQL